MSVTLTPFQGLSTKGHVLDASALLALLNDEPGAQRVTLAMVAGAVVSAVNFSEVVAKLSDGGMPEDAIAATLGALELHVIPFDRDLGFAAGRLRPATRRAGLSLGDRACLALALREGVPALTTDRPWKLLDIGVEIDVIR